MSPLLDARDVVKHFPVRSSVLRRTIGHVRAVDGVSLTVEEGRTVGLVGESGSGKSTLGRLLVRLLDPTAGSIVFDGTDIAGLKAGPMRSLRRDLQMVFQDPYSSMDPLATVADSIAEPIQTHLALDRAARDARVT
ncbi:MAG: ATP-binding cassette domain-containing protein, partial [Acidimicrobiales bacterium]|nr:ATP-binding cassette domain-containing protein [Acidimicrobiales bacterium]